MVLPRACDGEILMTPNTEAVLKTNRYVIIKHYDESNKKFVNLCKEYIRGTSIDM
jgi:hypothetical protein